MIFSFTSAGIFWRVKNFNPDKFFSVFAILRYIVTG